MSVLWRHAMRGLELASWVAVFIALGPPFAIAARVISRSPARIQPHPAGATLLPIEVVEGVILLPVTLRGIAGRDTAGMLVVDTGAGFLGLDGSVATQLGLTPNGVPPSGLTLVPTSLPRLELGATQIDALAPIILFDAAIIRRATGRNVLGLAGQGVFAGRVLWIDYTGRQIALMTAPAEPGITVGSQIDTLESAGGDATIEARRSTSRAARAVRSRAILGALLSRAAQPLPFRLAGDRKIIINGRFKESEAVRGGPWMQFVFDTGATKSVLFEPALSGAHPASKYWKSITGVVAPTLTGNTAARLTLVPVFELESADPRKPIHKTRVDCAVIQSELSEVLSNSVGTSVAGLLGYSFFKGSRIAIDYPNRVLWLDADPHYPGAQHTLRSFEYSHPGLQLECDGGSIRVLGVADGSPADSAGIAVGDTVTAVGTDPVSAAELSEVSRRLEGKPGTYVRIIIKRDGVQRSYRLVRRRLL